MSSTYKHSVSSHFRYEKVTRPYLGPRKRAQQALSRVVKQADTEEDFLDYLQIYWPDFYAALEWVRFHNFNFIKKTVPFQYRIAIMSVKADPVIRDLFFEKREIITEATGWYPLIQGSRAQIYDKPYRNSEYQRGQQIPHTFSNIGLLTGIEPIANNDMLGNCFLIKGSSSNLLLDAGMGEQPLNNTNSSFLFLSHSHLDHSGGIWEYLKNNKPSVILSQATLTYLYTLEQIPLMDRKRLVEHSNYPEDLGDINLADGGNIRFFPVFHCPGAYGTTITDKNGTSITYFGDLCLKNGFRNFINEALNAIPLDTGKSWVLLDAAMVGRKEQVIAPHDTPETIIEELLHSVRCRNVVFLSNQPENLIYSYLKTFKLTSQEKKPIRIFTSDDLYTTIQCLWKSVILRKFATFDPVVQQVIGEGMNNFAESHRLYPIREEIISKVSSTEPCIFFLKPSEVFSLNTLAERVNNSDVIISGTMAIRNEIPEPILLAHPRSILRVASADWGFHSDDESLAEFIRTITSNKVKVLLFHNYEKRINRFIKQYALDQTYVQALTEPINFS